MEKKMFIAFMIIMPILLLGGCKKTASDSEDMMKIAREEIPIADAEIIDMQIIGTIDKDEIRLVCFMTGNEYQAQTFFPIEFKRISHEKYEFVKVHEMLGRGMDIHVEPSWKDGYVFIVNNDRCKSIQITSSDGELQLVEVGKLPFLFYFEEIPKEYDFLDADGNPLN